MITIQHLREMNRRDFSKALRKLNKNSIIEILEVEGIWVKYTSKTDELIDILLDVVDGIRTSTEEDVNKLNAKNKRRETIRRNKERKRLEEEERNRQRTEEERRLKGIWDNLNNYEKSLIVWNYGFDNNMCHVGVIFDLIERGLVPSFINEDRKLIDFMEDIELNNYKGCKRLLFYVHPDTCQNYKTYQYVDLSKNFEMFKKIFGIER
ncbi:hypothetical protein C4D33_05750 [Clostridium perfringens]